MISIVICSVNAHLLEKMKANIANTIGLNYECIAIDNSIEKQGICAVYNKGAALAKYPVIGFLHEDILFETQNWGAIIVELLNNPAIGLIGIAGGDTKSMVPSTWAQSFFPVSKNVIQHFKNNSTTTTIYKEPVDYKASTKAVLMLDGVMLFTKKSITAQFQFSESLLNGFHGYDIDFSLQVSRQYTLLVTYDIIIHHYSEGHLSSEWMQSAEIIADKWKNQLPLSIYPLSFSQFQLHHWQSLQFYIQELLRLQYSSAYILKKLLKYTFTPFFSIRHFLSLSKYVFLSVLKRHKRDKQAEDLSTNTQNNLTSVKQL